MPSALAPDCRLHKAVHSESACRAADLWDGGPAGELLDAFPDGIIREHIPTAVLHPVCIQDPARHVAEAALGCLWHTLQEAATQFQGDQFLDSAQPYALLITLQYKIFELCVYQ